MEFLKDYKLMTGEEQVKFLVELNEFVNEKLPRLKTHGDAWGAADRKDVEQGLRLLGAFPFARDFVGKAFRYGDFKARVARLDVYVEKAKQAVSAGVAVRDSNGKAYAFVPALQQQFRRRGRPTREEAYAKSMAATIDDAESKRQQAIARLLDIEIVTNQTLRERNNAELAVLREQKRQEEAKVNPSLFGGESRDNGITENRNNDLGGETAEHKTGADGSPAGEPAGTVTTTIPPTIESLSEARLHLDQVRFLLSPELQQRVDTVRELRNKASVAAETAKAMALKGEKPEAVEPYAKQAAEATEQYEQIYDAVDNELGTVHYRLLNDGDYKEKFAQRFHVKDFTAILKQLKPYYEKVKSPEFEVRMKALIEQESPEYVARMKAEKEKKDEVEGILRYLRRKDKPASDARVQGAETKYKRLVELLGKDMAKDYRPLVDFIIEENKKLHESAASVGSANESQAVADAIGGKTKKSKAEKK